MSDHDRLSELVPVYAIGALPVDEESEIQSHLAVCDACREELSDALTVAADLTGFEQPPFGVWERIEETIDPDRLGSPAPIAVLSEARSARRWRLVASIAATAAMVFAGLFLNLLSEEAVFGAEDVLAAADEAASQSGAIVTDLMVAETAVARLILTPDGHGFVVPSEALPELDQSRTYQLWVINQDEQVISAGSIGHDPMPATFTWTGEVAGFALTREVAGGVVSSAGDVVSVVSDL